MITRASLERINEKVFVDIPASAPRIQCTLQKVGVTNRPYAIRVRDPFGEEVVTVAGDIRVFFGLPARQRGLHMSRIEEGLLHMRSEQPVPMNIFLEKLCAELKRSQGQDVCGVAFSAVYEKESMKNGSQKPSFEIMRLYSARDENAEGKKETCGVTVSFMNACPCTQRWGMREFYNKLQERGWDDEKIAEVVDLAPLQAHTQRGEATVRIESDKVDHQQVYSILDKSLPIIRELLKGQDEHAFVRATHQEAMFCEDCMRSVMKNVVQELDGKIDPLTWIEIVIDVDESVHYHNLYSEFRGTLAELKAQMN